MKKAEKILLGFLTIGAILKLVELPAGSISIVLSSTILMLFYFPFGFLTLKGQQKETKIKGYPLAAGFGLSIACLALMFLFERWPGGTMYFWFGSSLSLLILVYSIIKSEVKDFKNYHGVMKLRSGLLFVLVLVAMIRF